MVSVSGSWIATALDQLRAHISAGNQKGNVEGLLARHLVASDSRLDLQWTVDCDEVWMSGVYDPSHLGHVAALAYTLVHTGSGLYHRELEAGLQRAAARDPKTAGLGSALHDPAVLVGLCLGSDHLKDISGQYVSWCASVLRSLPAAQRRVDPVLAYAAHLCGTGSGAVVMDLNAPLLHRAALDWWFRTHQEKTTANAENVEALRRSVVEQVLSEPLPQLPAHQAALLWLCLRAAVADTTVAALQTPASIAHALKQFEASMKRWRWDADRLQRPVRWPVRSEREVQDVLWAILRPICADLEDEDALPKFGHSTYRADFGIPSLGLLIEVKFASAAGDFKAIEKEVLEDIVPYLKSPERYREILIFIYDDSCSVQHHDTTARALKSVAGIADVVIACRPSQLPPAAAQSSPTG